MPYLRYCLPKFYTLSLPLSNCVSKMLTNVGVNDTTLTYLLKPGHMLRDRKMFSWKCHIQDFIADDDYFSSGLVELGYGWQSAIQGGRILAPVSVSC